MRRTAFSVLLLAATTSPALSEGARFDTPQAALEAFVGALEANNQSELLTIFGPEAEDLIGTGDPAEDQQRRQDVLSMYAEGYRFQPQENEVVLLLGEDSWPFPIPISRTADGWRFDIEAGIEELSAREIGLNELEVIDLLEAYVDLQAAFRLVDHNGDGVMEFAQTIISDPGERNGLFWPEDEGFVGAALARAAATGWSDGEADYEAEPFLGYTYSILQGQGENAPGGAHSYFVGDKFIAGHALLAVPAEYGETGIHSFMVGENGIVYEADFGPETLDQTAEITTYDPNSDWSAVE
ncbi:MULTISPECIES: DUF2950 domain-containing protein [Halocynthiibacter]|uniref:DUF2950 domain-containing protein n=1 Tax=Halocynthiibacter halioticoli TaxID=2986804 RepID=A0AAE3IVJ2_9RHOB|nr:MULTISPECIES: DUF2950 domain-containing protein [Halocynthiibacter]MCV6822952.1 DUF2950 domain-containing protein [Halocynthiibacter halioticoli]MCW4055953.1 DUF2950 domain-containing protein [Halocynthiibacter sp. SDUM655004]